MKLDRICIALSLSLAMAACGGGSHSSVNDPGAIPGGSNGNSAATPTTPTTPSTNAGTQATPVTTSDSYQAPNARFDRPLAITVDGSGNLFVAGNGTIRKITPGGVVSTVAGAPGQYGPVPSGGVDGTGSAARFNVTSGIAADSRGNLYVADTFANTGRIRKIAPGAIVTTIFSGVYALGIAAGPTGSIHFTDNVNLRVTTLSASGDVSQSGQIGAGPQGIAADSLGNLFVTNTGQVYRPLGQTAFSCTIEKIAANGLISTLAGSMAKGEFDNTCGHIDGKGPAAKIGSNAQGIAVDGAGNVFFTDTSTHTIRRLAPDGTVTTIAGKADSSGSSDGAGEAARFNEPRGITVGSDGNLYVADTENHTIRRVTPGGVVTTAAGKAGKAGSVDTAAPRSD